MDPRIDLKVIHLARDPRAIFNSRHSIGHYTVKGDLQWICKRHQAIETDIRNSTTEFKEWFSKYAMSVRYANGNK